MQEKGKVRLGKQCPGRILGIVGQDPKASNSNRLHVAILYMITETRQLVTNEPVEFEKQLVEVQD